MKSQAALPPTRVRKCISAMRKVEVIDQVGKPVLVVSPNGERMAFFYCLKMLGVLPPPPLSDFGSWEYFAFTNFVDQTKNIRYKPKCLHDVLIATHATSCEHGNLFFSYYHRHQMILTEIFLNFAHRVLKGGPTFLRKIYPEDQFPNLYNAANSKEWQDVFKRYSGFQGVPEQMSCHYWAPTDYLSPDNLKIPSELAYKASPTDPIDLLFFKINSSYPWEIHVPRRWYNDPSEYKPEDIARIFKRTQYDTSLNAKFDLFIQGQLDPREHPEDFSQIIQLSNKTKRNRFNYNLFLRNRDQGALRNQQQFSEAKKNIRLNPISEAESQSIYGAEFKKTNWISPQQRVDKDLTPSMVQSYNWELPHYQYAHALFNTTVKEFLTVTAKGYEMSHNFMHNNFGFILMDSVFSVTSLIFYPYHSWIDLQLELKIRRTNKEGSVGYESIRKFLDDEVNAETQAFLGRLKDVFGKLGSYIQPIADFKVNQVKIQANSAGFYPVVQWIQPTKSNVQESLTNISASFCSRDYVLTKTTLRSSFDLNHPYSKYLEHYKTNNDIDRFYFFENISNFNFNFNYQIGDKIQNLDTLLDENGQTLPAFLNKIKVVWDTRAQINSTSISFAKKQAKFTHLSSEQDEEEDLQIRKVLGSGIQVFASHPVDAENGPNPVFVRLKKVMGCIKDGLSDTKYPISDKEINELEGFVSSGLCLNNIFIFGRASLAETCPKCKDSKKVYVDLDQRFKDAAPRLWKYVHTKALNEKLYDSTDPNHQLKCIYQKLELSENSIFNDYRFVRGAEQIQIDIFDKTQIKGVKGKYIRIDAESYSVETNSLKNVVTKKFECFRKSFDFYKIFEADVNKNSNFFDHFVFKRLRIFLKAGKQTKQFIVEIPTFQRLLRLNLIITAEEGKPIEAVLFDKDYGLKKAYYNNVYELTQAEDAKLKKLKA